MKKAIKWISIIAGSLLLLFILAIIIIPKFINVEKFQPRIEAEVIKATGRKFSLGTAPRLTLFPWAGIKLADIRLGNISGMTEENFISVDNIDARVKIMPFLTKRTAQVRFVLNGPHIVLEKGKDGQNSWDFKIPVTDKKVAKTEEKKTDERPASEKQASEQMPVKNFILDEFAITNGTVLYIDHTTKTRKEITDVNLSLEDVTLERPIRIIFSAKLDQQPVFLDGKIGPIGKEPGREDILVDITLKALEQIVLSLNGKIITPMSNPAFDMTIRVEPFSPRNLVAAMGQKFPVKTADKDVLKKVSFDSKIKGNSSLISISDGHLLLDDSTMIFSMTATEFDKPNLVFSFDLDEIDVDRYLPPPEKKKNIEQPDKKEEQAAADADAKPIDYKPLRKVIMDGSLTAGKVKAMGARMENVTLKINAKNGLINIDPFGMTIYGGTIASVVNADVRANTPATKVKLEIDNVQAGPLLRDVIEKDILEGMTKATITLDMKGDDPDRIKRTLNGEGKLTFKDGAVKGIDLAGMVRNLKATFGAGEPGGEKPRTDFGKLNVPFTITKGLFNSKNTTMVSPFIRVLVSGDAHLVKETLDMRVEPKFVGTIKGQGDKTDHSGITVPVLITGTFTEPKFTPDLKGILKQNLGVDIPDSDDLKKELGKTLSGEKSFEKTGKELEKKGDEILKGLFQ
ncbi:MAG: AsmA family protein [Desulfobacterales bacterium]|nr:AsmA family protein [Desulfobacterales bacterium]